MLIAGIALVLISVLLGTLVLSRARHTVAVVGVARDLAAGTQLHSGDLQLVQVQLPESNRVVYLSAISAAVGRTLSRSLSAGELLPAAAVRTADAGTTVSVPLAPGTAPDLRSGQRARFWVSTKTCQAVVLLGDATVQSVRASSGAFSSAGGQDVTLQLPQDLAERVMLALALPDAQLRVGVLSGAADPNANASLAPLDQCAAAP
jgi:hypothetical protein